VEPSAATAEHDYVFVIRGIVRVSREGQRLFLRVEEGARRSRAAFARFSHLGNSPTFVCASLIIDLNAK
jgi:hypothetical protein